MRITKDIENIGVTNSEETLFEGQYKVSGMRYNSYVILDEKTAVLDSVELASGDLWMQNLEDVLEGNAPDYFIVQHMEPDHAANIERFIEKYPNTKIVGNKKTFTMLSNFFRHLNLEGKTLEVKSGDTLSLGTHELSFLTAPMVHWPEVMVTYDSHDKVLFSADAFGTFGDSSDAADWEKDAARYYFGIVGKYGPNVQSLLKKVAALDIQTICSLHGPVLTEPAYYIDQYDKWSRYEADKKGVVIACASIYGHTMQACEALKAELEKDGCPNVILHDLTTEVPSEALVDAFRYDNLVLASVTYNGTIFPCMKSFVTMLKERNYQNRRVGFVENGSWGPVAAKTMKGLLEESKDLTFAETTVTVKSSVDEIANAAITELAKELSA